MAKQVKGGYLMRYRKKMFGKTWREEWVTLLEDSTLAWFKEKDRRAPEGRLVVRDAPEMVAMGAWTLRIPARPELPVGCHVVQLMAFGNRRRDKVHWLLAKNEEEVNDWMSAISNTLPPPPQPLKPPDSDKTEPANQRLPAISYTAPVTGNNSSAVYPESEFVPASILVVDRGSQLLKGRGSWGHGWGWMCYNHDGHVATTMCYNHADMHVVAPHLYDQSAYDDPPDVDFGDSDLNMFSGDFLF